MERKKFPHDIDLLTIHSSKKLDEFYPISQRKDLINAEKITKLNSLFKKKIDLLEVMKHSKLKKEILQRKININYINKKILLDENYRRWLKKINSEFHDEKILKGTRKKDEDFLSYVFRRGKLWDYKKKSYSIQLKWSISQ